MFTITSKFGGLANRAEPHLIGPNLAQALENVNLDSEGIKPIKGLGATITTGSGTPRSLYKFNGNWSIDTIAWQYVEYGGQAIRVASGRTPQKTADGTNWHNLGITPPQAACSAAAGAAGTPNGTYIYFVTFTSSLGGESGPSPSATVTVASQRVSLTNIPTGLSTGSTTNASTSITAVTNISAWTVGMRISGSGIPAGATVEAVDSGASTLTLSAAATATAAGVTLTDPQYNARKIYRQGGTASGTLLVTTLSDMTTTTYTDNTADSALGAAMTTSGYAAPPLLQGVAISPYGTLLGFVDDTLHYAETGKPYAFKATNTIGVNEDVKAVAHFAGQFLVLSTAAPYLILGTNADTFRMVNIPSQQGCVERDTVVDMGFGIFYLSPDGICVFEGRTVEVISKQGLSDTFMAGVASAHAKAVKFNERYILFVQSGTSFPSGGYLEWDQRIDGKWKQGTIAANAVHYNKTDDALYVAEGANVKQWEGGSDSTYSYQTGDWVDKQFTFLKHWRSIAVDHDGAVNVLVYVDGTQVGTTKALSRASLGRSYFRLPPGVRGRRLSVKVTGTGRVVEILAEIGKKAGKL